MDRKPFNFGDFRKWMKDQGDEQNQGFKYHGPIGSTVEPKLEAKKIAHRIKVEEGNRDKLAEEFEEFGGTVAEVNGNNFLIQVPSGVFYISKHYLKKV